LLFFAPNYFRFLLLLVWLLVCLLNIFFFDRRRRVRRQQIDRFLAAAAEETYSEIIFQPDSLAAAAFNNKTHLSRSHSARGKKRW
jgi:hypothetical protein